MCVKYSFMSTIYSHLDIYDDSDEDDMSIDVTSEESEESRTWETSSEEDEEDEEDDGAGVLTPRSRRKLLDELLSA